MSQAMLQNRRQQLLHQQNDLLILPGDLRPRFNDNEVGTTAARLLQIC